MKRKGLSFYIVISIIFLFLIVLPLVSFFITSLAGVPNGIILLFTDPRSLHFSFSGYLEIFKNHLYVSAIAHTVILGISVVLLSFLLSLPIALLFSRTDAKSKIIIRTILMISLAIPGFIIAYVFIIMDSISGSRISFIYSFYGLLGVMTIAMIPFMVNYVTLSFNNLDYRLVEASLANGNSKMKTFLGVTIPLLTPGIVSGMVIVFLLTTGSLSVPLLLAPPSYQVLSTSAYTQLFSFFNWQLATAMLFVLFLINLVAIIIQTYLTRKTNATIQGKGFHQRMIRRKSIKALLIVYSTIISLLPIAEIIVISLSGFSSKWILSIFPQTFSLSPFSSAISLYPFSITSTLITTVAAGGLAVLISVLISYNAKILGNRSRRLLNTIIMLAFAMSNIIIGISFLSLYNNHYTGFMVQRIPLMLILGYTTGRLGYASNSVSISFDSLSNSLLEAARLMGNKASDLFRKILLPLVLPGILEGFLFVTVRSAIDYASTLFLAPQNWYTLALSSYGLITTGELHPGSSAAFLIIIIVIPISVLTYYFRQKTFQERRST
ncbi:MAG: ABC transporter permease subunit [Candidatus Thermoplasmatota archaeon]|jgi:iron(III) transport system permease protein|nr:ABC transporter permease subunit [Candidatus Thermoplasmatota archaeon]